MNIIGVVLAGGLSSRMNQDKSQLVWQGKKLLQHSCNLLSESGCSQLLISNNERQDSIADRYPNSGPLAGIEACLHHILNHCADAEAMLVIPVDMPLMNPGLLANICQKAKPGKAVYYASGRFPLLLPVNRELSAILLSILEQQGDGAGLSVRRLLSQLDCQVLEIDKTEETAFYNCNTPEDWNNLISRSE